MHWSWISSASIYLFPCIYTKRVLDAIPENDLYNGFPPNSWRTWQDLRMGWKVHVKNYLVKFAFFRVSENLLKWGVRADLNIQPTKKKWTDFFFSKAKLRRPHMEKMHSNLETIFQVEIIIFVQRILFLEINETWLCLESCTVPTESILFVCLFVCWLYLSFFVRLRDETAGNAYEKYIKLELM